MFENGNERKMVLEGVLFVGYNYTCLPLLDYGGTFGGHLRNNIYQN